MGCYSYPIFLFPLLLGLLWRTDRRIGWSTKRRQSVRETDLSENVVVGMISGYGIPFGTDGPEKELLASCINHAPVESSESKLYGDQGLCKRGLTVTAIGNGICNGHLNVPAYGFDFGDCCLPELQCVSPYHALISTFSYFWS